MSKVKLSHHIAAGSVFLIMCSVLIQLPIVFYIVGGVGIIASYMVYGLEGYNYYRDSIRFIVWGLIPIFSFLFALSNPNEFSELYQLEFSKLWLLGVFACGFLSVYYNRWDVNRAAKIFVIVTIVSFATISVTNLYEHQLLFILQNIL
jgi:hypothetical protein